MNMSERDNQFRDKGHKIIVSWYWGVLIIYDRLPTIDLQYRTFPYSFKILAKFALDGVVARAEFGAPGCGCFPTTTVILLNRQAWRPAPLYNEETCCASRPLRSQTRGWKSRLLRQVASVTSSRPLLWLIFKVRVFCADGPINPASSTRNLETAPSASVRCFCLIYLNSILNVHFL